MEPIFRALLLTVPVCLLWVRPIAGDGFGLPLLVFPPTNPTRVQIISGIGIPVALNFESVVIGYALKAEYFMPENASNIINILGDPFNVSPRPISDGLRKRRAAPSTIDEPQRGYDAEQQQRFERYDAIAVEVDAGPNAQQKSARRDYEYDDVAGNEGRSLSHSTDDNSNIENELNDKDDDDEGALPPLTLADVRIKERNNLYAARFALYHGFETIVQRNGLPGRPCMLRSICEAAHAQFSYHNGILGELAHIVMSPSTSPDPLVKHSDGEYLRAEQLGRAGEPCGQVFRECPISVLDKFSGMYNMMDGIMNVLG